jgi:hypothetical protein
VTAAKSTALADRLATLGIAPDELAAMIRRPVDEVEAWVAGDVDPDGEARVLLRVLADDHRAALAVQRVRDGWTADLRGDGAAYAGIEGVPPYGGGHTGETGGRPE